MPPKKVKIDAISKGTWWWAGVSAVAFLVVIAIGVGVVVGGIVRAGGGNGVGDKVCLTTTEYQKLADAQASCARQEGSSAVNQVMVPKPVREVDNAELREGVKMVQERDYRVLEDPLYPPMNRTDTVNTAVLQSSVGRRNFNVPTQTNTDTFRLVGYLINKEEKKDMGGNNWKLFARQKDRNRAEFYMMPADKNYDVKVFLKDDVVVGTRLTDVYSLPNEMHFKSPMLNEGAYEFIENPKTDFTGPYF